MCVYSTGKFISLVKKISVAFKKTKKNQSASPTSIFEYIPPNQPSGVPSISGVPLYILPINPGSQGDGTNRRGFFIIDKKYIIWFCKNTCDRG